MISSNEKLLAVFESMAAKLDVRYDRSELRKLFGAAEDAGGDPLGSLYRVAERYRIRLGVFDCSFDEALQFVRQGYPIAIAPPAESLGGSNTSAINDDWWVLLDIGRRGVLSWSTRLGGRKTRKSIRSLRAILAGSNSSDTNRRLIVAQPLDADIMGSHHDKPLKRLLHLLRPDRGDIYAIAVFSLVVGILALATPLAVESMVNTVAFNRYFQPIIVLSIVLFVFLTFAGVLTVIKALESEIIQRRLFVRVALDLGHRLSNANHADLDNHDGRELVNRFIDITTIQKAVASMLLDGLALVIAVVIGMAVLAAYHPFLLGFDIVLLALMMFMVFVIGRGAVDTSINESLQKYRMLAWLQNVISAPTAFQFHGGDQFAMDRTDNLAAQYVDLRRNHFSILVRQIVFAVSVEVVASVALLSIGGFLVINNQLTLGQLVAAELIVAVIVGSFAKVGKHLETYYDLMAAVDKVGHVLDLAEANVGGHDLLQSEGPLSIEVRDLSVEAGGTTPIQGFTARMSAGSSAVVIGPAGSGKSVLIETLATLRRPTAGSISVNGVDLRQVDHAHFTRNIGYARAIEVIEGTIGENVDLHRPEVRAPEIKAALELVGLWEDISKLPEALNTELSSNGRPLSSSQIARLMIARAIAGRPPLVLIDSLLDGLAPQTAEEIISQLHRRPMPWSVIVATSRADFVDLFVEKWILNPKD